MSWASKRHALTVGGTLHGTRAAAQQAGYRGSSLVGVVAQDTELGSRPAGVCARSLHMLSSQAHEYQFSFPLSDPSTRTFASMSVAGVWVMGRVRTVFPGWAGLLPRSDTTIGDELVEKQVGGVAEVHVHVPGVGDHVRP